MTELHPDDQALIDLFGKAERLAEGRDFILSWVIADPLLAEFDNEAKRLVLCTDPEHCGNAHVARFLATGEYDDTPGERKVLNLPLAMIRNLQRVSPVADFRFWMLDHAVMVRRTGTGLATDYKVIREVV